MDTANQIHAGIFDEAADYIEEHGWYQGGYFPTGPESGAAYKDIARVYAEQELPMCIVGATVGAAGYGLSYFATATLGEEYRRRYPESPASAAAWNDLEATKEQVIALLRDIAKKQRAEASE